MEMKGMLFAGGGLFLSMVATTMWISGDVSRMRAEEQAKDAQRCAMAQADQQQAAAPVGTAGEFTTPPANQAGDACPEDGQAAPAGDPNAGTIDPLTGQPVESVPGDLGVAGGAGDPGAQQSFDAAAGQSLPVDQAQAVMPATDPSMGSGVTGAPVEGMAEAGF